MRIRSEWRSLKVFCLAAILALAVGCGSDGEGGNGEDDPGKDCTGEACYPEIEIVPAETCDAQFKNCKYNIDQAVMMAGDVMPVFIRVRNTGERRMEIQNIALNYTAPDGAVEPTPAFELVRPAAFEEAVATKSKFYVAPLGKATEGMPDDLAVKINFTRYDDDAIRTAELVVDTDASNVAQGLVKIRLGVLAGNPKITVSPDVVVFTHVGMGEEQEQKVNILNTGAADLQITGFSMTGSEFYTLIVQGTDYPVGDATQAVTFTDSIVVPPASQTYFKVRFTPEDDKGANAKLLIYSNDPEKPDGVEVKVSGNESVPCIAVNPKEVNFGGKKLGEVAVTPLQISACGEAQLEIYDIKIKDGSSPDFDVDLSTLETLPTKDTPVIVPISGSVTVNVTFTPDQENPVDGNGSLILDQGVLLIKNNSFEMDKEVPILGAGVTILCPTAIIKCAEGDEVIPQTVLHLYGDESYAASGNIQKWEWKVDQPAGSQSVFVPSYTFPNPTFETNVAGVYTFYLTVFDQMNVPSCFPATYEVVVIPDEAIHIELLWHTPEDLVETDTGPEAGSDVDLHFLHPYAAGPDLDGDGAPDGWFDIPFDAFWFNAHPNWGSYDPAINDDPGLDRDDTDGAGPENINLDIPENVTYRVGVHYWNDHNFGSAYATVRVYIYAQLVFEVTDTLLVDSDMWEVCTVEWPSGKVHVTTDAVGQYKITPQYKNPYFFQD